MNKLYIFISYPFNGILVVTSFANIVCYNYIRGLNESEVSKGIITYPLPLPVDITMYNPILQNTIDRVKATDAKVFVPNPQGGRPPNRGSVTYWLRQILAENEGIKAYDLANKVLQQALDGSCPHQNIVLERVDGNVASEINVKGVFLHVGDEYASQGLAAMREDMTNKQLEASQMPQISNSNPTNGQTGIQLPSGENDPIKIDDV